MKLNCKQGDLAVLVRSVGGNEGKIVCCDKLTIGTGALGFGPRWMTTPKLTCWCGCGVVVYPLDANLRPLRDSDGEDEVLRLVGRPVGTPQAA